MEAEGAVDRSLQLAWEAAGTGTVPVGAVVTDAGGQVLFEGRSRMYEQSAPAGELADSLLAHAEINALARLDPNRRHVGLTLTSSLEPCPLCLGAVHMATVGRLVFLGRDPYGGAVGRLQDTPHTARVPVLVEGPDPGPLGLLASAMHVAFYLERNPAGQVVTTHRQLAPEILRAASALACIGWRQTAESGVALAEVLPTLLDAVRPA